MSEQNDSSSPSSPSYRALRIEKSGPIVEVVLIGPGKGNAMGPDFWKELPRAFAQIDQDPEVRCAIVRGEGGNFSYGLDLKAMIGELGPLIMGESLAAQRTKLLALIGELQRSLDAVARARVPVIAAIEGWCIGGGVDLITACDVRVSTADARFSVREVKVAMVADLGSLQRLPAIVGQGHARQLALTGGNLDAARALRIGLVNDVFETREAMLDGARAMAREIADNPPLVVQGIKAVMNDCQGKTIADGLRHVALWNSAFLQSHDLGEAFASFAERRPPKYSGT